MPLADAAAPSPIPGPGAQRKLPSDAHQSLVELVVASGYDTWGTDGSTVLGATYHGGVPVIRTETFGLQFLPQANLIVRDAAVMAGLSEFQWNALRSTRLTCANSVRHTGMKTGLPVLVIAVGKILTARSEQGISPGHLTGVLGSGTVR